MKNRLTDLNDHLFAQMERLGEEGISEEQIKQEVARSKAMARLADQVIQNAKVQVDVCKTIALHGEKTLKNLPMIQAPKEVK